MAGKPFLHHKPTSLLPFSPIIKLSFIKDELFIRFDLALSLAFQGQGTDGIKTLSRHVQRALRTRWHGYLPPGSCLITSLPSASDIEDAGAGDGNPFGASCIAVLPTMRYPVDVRWHQDLVYNAVWSLLVEVRRWNTETGVRNSAHDGTETKTIQRVLMTGLGTGYGQVSVARCAQQMILAIKHFVLGVVQEYADWGNVDSLIKEVDATLEL
jgi:O-acetyl-ADP-ribose deacetylase (regulator of RNase III)